jgi:hypothetical protein
MWINLSSIEEATPTNGTLRLFSGSQDSYYEYNIADLLASNSEWGNMTFAVGSTQGWTATNSPDWA